MLLALPNGDFHRKAEGVHNQSFQVLCQERVQYDDNCAKKALHPSSGANGPSDFAITVNINAQCNLS
jgi:hypothetical protein